MDTNNLRYLPLPLIFKTASRLNAGSRDVSKYVSTCRFFYHLERILTIGQITSSKDIPPCWKVSR